MPHDDPRVTIAVADSLRSTSPCTLLPGDPGADADRERSAWLDSFLDAGPVDVSVCIANWNCLDVVRNCLESLQDRPQGVRFETIVVDNASTDGAADMIVREFPEVRLVRNDVNVGFSRANNQAARLARGRYLFFLNNDTILPEGTLGKLVDYARAHPEVGMIGPRLRDGAGGVQVSSRPRMTLTTFLHRLHLLRWTGVFRERYRQYRREQFDPDSTRQVDVLLGAAVLLPRDIFFQAGQWDEEFRFGGEDLDLSRRVQALRPLVFLPTVEITHLGRVSTRQHIGFASLETAVGFVLFLRKSGIPRPLVWLYKALVTLDAPIHWSMKAIEFAWRSLHGQRQRAEKTRLVLQGLAHFLVRGLPRFWSA